jgi:hypothetical protein
MGAVGRKIRWIIWLTVGDDALVDTDVEEVDVLEEEDTGPGTEDRGSEAGASGDEVVDGVDKGDADGKTLKII